jgi:hypothetical protein
MVSMSSPLPPSDDLNPYSAPQSRDVLAQLPDSDREQAEALRREHLKPESYIKFLSLVLFLGALLFGAIGLGGIVLAITGFGQMRLEGVQPALVTLAFVAVFALVPLGVACLCFALGVGLRRFQTWSRWTTVVCSACVLGLVGLVVLASVFNPRARPNWLLDIVIAAPLFTILRVLLAPSAATIFSPEYHLAVACTPHLRRVYGDDEEDL